MVASCPWGPPAPHPFHALPGAPEGGVNAGRGPHGLPSGVCPADWATTRSVRHSRASWPDHRVGRGPASEHTDAHLDSATPEAAAPTRLPSCMTPKSLWPTCTVPFACSRKCCRGMKTRASLRAQQTEAGAPGPQVSAQRLEHTWGSARGGGGWGGSLEGQNSLPPASLHPGPSPQLGVWGPLNW